jgi:hypothetical protein
MFSIRPPRLKVSLLSSKPYIKLESTNNGFIDSIGGIHRLQIQEELDEILKLSPVSDTYYLRFD